ncbi:hypothetical protein EAI_10970 [Harpegnathos saltator]|uniref:Uncharacterized protein n=1 Tax=Harpegnathos saltator TaxID=610380 RepID=E2B761_HARSA|nr:hypothetical protein EAI_10970 [Harpegnathos saltator]
MGDIISSAVIGIINESNVMLEEDLILFDDNDNEGVYEECPDDPTTDETYDPSDAAQILKDYIPLEYKTKIVALAEAHPHWNLKTLQEMGGGRLKRKDSLILWKT